LGRALQERLAPQIASGNVGNFGGGSYGGNSYRNFQQPQDGQPSKPVTSPSWFQKAGNLWSNLFSAGHSTSEVEEATQLSNDDNVNDYHYDSDAPGSAYHIHSDATVIDYGLIEGNYVDNYVEGNYVDNYFLPAEHGISQHGISHESLSELTNFLNKEPTTLKIDENNLVYCPIEERDSKDRQYSKF
jgi:hypothetical protein